jgi:hypothetical protein
MKPGLTGLFVWRGRKREKRKRAAKVGLVVF